MPGSTWKWPFRKPRRSAATASSSPPRAKATPSSTRATCESRTRVQHEPPPGRPKHFFISRTLSAQIAAIQKLFPDYPTTALYTTTGKPVSLDLIPDETNPPLTSQDLDHSGDRTVITKPTRQERRADSHDGTHRVTTTSRNQPYPVSPRSSSLPRVAPVKRPTLFSSLDQILDQSGHHDEAVQLDRTLYTSYDSLCASNDSQTRRLSAPVLAFEERPSTLSRKPDVGDLRRASAEKKHARSLSMPPTRLDREAGLRPLRASWCHDLDKPLPPVPVTNKSDRVSSDTAVRDQHFPSQPTTCLPHHNNPHSAEDVTLHSSTHREWSPAVTHHTFTRRVHEVREEQIIRHTHEHHYHHRTLPIVEVEMLPPRHFVRSGHEYFEISEEDIPSELRPREEVLMSEAMLQLLSNHSSPKQDGFRLGHETESTAYGDDGQGDDADDAKTRREHIKHVTTVARRPARVEHEAVRPVLLHFANVEDERDVEGDKS